MSFTADGCAMCESGWEGAGVNEQEFLNKLSDMLLYINIISILFNSINFLEGLFFFANTHTHTIQLFNMRKRVGLSSLQSNLWSKELDKNVN